MERHVTEWARALANHTPNKDLVSRIHKELSKLKSKKSTIQLKNG